MNGKCRKKSTEITERMPERDEKYRKDSKEEKKERRRFQKTLRRIGFIIMVTRKEFRTSINRRAISLKVDRFQHRFQVRFRLIDFTFDFGI